jgi:hypothetical protein
MTSGIQRIYRHESTNYTTVPNWVVRDPRYSPNTFRLLAYLLSHQSGYELTYGQIERQTTLGRYAINEAAKFLISEGWLEWSQDKGPDGKWLAKTWIIKDPAIGQMSPVRNDSTTEPIRYGTTNGHKEEQLLENKTIKRNTLTRDQERELFEEFYKEYPRKMKRGDAIKAFSSALNRATFEELLAGAIRLKNDPNLPEERYIPYPATWLRADSWLDGPLPMDAKKQKELEKIQRDRELDEWARQQDELEQS